MKQGLDKDSMHSFAAGLIFCAWASLGFGPKHYADDPAATASIPLRMWVVQGNADTPYGVGDPTTFEQGCRLSEAQIDTYISGECPGGPFETCQLSERNGGLQRNSFPLFGVLAPFTDGNAVDVVSITSNFIPLPNPDNPTRFTVIQDLMDDLIHVQGEWVAGRMNIYFVGHALPRGAQPSGQLRGASIPADASLNSYSTWITDGGFDNFVPMPPGIDNLVAVYNKRSHTLEHETAHALLRNRGIGDYDSGEHVPAKTPSGSWSMNIMRIWNPFDTNDPGRFLGLPPDEQDQAGLRLVNGTWKLP